MNRVLVPWLLAGALAASLTWNWRLLESDSAPASCASPAAPSFADGQSCTSVSCAGLGLDAAQQAALAALCERSCGESDRLEARADELQRQLLARLAQPAVDEPAARALVSDVAELRRRSLEACVTGILGVRRVLTPEQTATFLSECAARCKPGASCR